MTQTAETLTSRITAGETIIIEDTATEPRWTRTIAPAGDGQWTYAQHDPELDETRTRTFGADQIEDYAITLRNCLEGAWRERETR